MIVSKRISNTSIKNDTNLLLSIDQHIELLVTKLIELDALDDTYVIYKSDIGCQSGQHHCIADLYIQVPFLIHGLDIDRNTTMHDITLNIDFVPIICQIVKSDNDSSDWEPPLNMDGRLSPSLLHGKRKNSSINNNNDTTSSSSS